MDRPAVLLIDVQREYFTPESPLWIPDGTAVLERLQSLLAAARETGAGVVHVRHEEEPTAGVSAVVDDGLDPQAALDRARFRVEDDAVHIEEGLWPQADELERAGHTVVLDPDTPGFGGGQMILVEGDALVGGSDPRKDGYAAGS